MSTILKAVTAWIICASLCVLATLPVFAQEEQQAIQPAEETGRWVGLLLAVFFLIALCIGCYMTPKRTHQD